MKKRILTPALMGGGPVETSCVFSSVFQFLAHLLHPMIVCGAPSHPRGPWSSLGPLIIIIMIVSCQEWPLGQHFPDFTMYLVRIESVKIINEIAIKWLLVKSLVRNLLLHFLVWTISTLGGLHHQLIVASRCGTNGMLTDCRAGLTKMVLYETVKSCFNPGILMIINSLAD